MSVVDSPARRAVIEQAVEKMRTQLRKGFGGGFEVSDERCPAPVTIDVVVDGATAWLVTVKCGERTIWTTGEAMCVRPDEFLNGLFVFVVACLGAAAKPPVRSLAS